MRPVVFVSDLGVHGQREVYRAALRAIVDPVLAHLPQGRWSETPVEGALNVRLFTITLDGRYDVFTSHGIADKAYRDWHVVRDFPHVFVSGPAWIDKYMAEGATPDRLWITGYSKLDPIFNGDIRRGDGPRILWAPTHPTSWPHHYEAVKRAVESLPFEVAMAPHPQLSRASTLQALVDADVVIADAGSTLYEAWALGKPVVFPSWLVRRARVCRPHTMERQLYLDRLGYHAENREDFARQIDLALTHGIGEREREFIEGILPTHLRGTSGQAYASALRQIAEES